MKPQLPSTSALQTFIVVAKNQNISAAAKELFLTQGAVSKQIKNLEGQLNTQLFHREARGLQLTLAGRSLLPIATDLVEKLTHLVGESPISSNRINLCAPGCVTAWILSKIEEFKTSHEGIEINLVSNYRHDESSYLDKFDAKIVYGQTFQSEQYDYHFLFEERLIPVFSPAYQEAISAAHSHPLRNIVLLHAETKEGDWKQWQQKYGDNIVGFNTYFSTLEQVTQAAVKGFGIGLCDISLIKDDLEDHRLLAYSKNVLITGKKYYLMTGKEPREPLQQLCSSLKNN